MKVKTATLKQIIREECETLREVFAAASKPPAGAAPTPPPGTPTPPGTPAAAGTEEEASKMSQAGEGAPTTFAAIINASQAKTALEALKGKLTTVSSVDRVEALALVMDRLGATEDDINKLKLKISEHIH
jgi:hypothetical protein